MAVPNDPSAALIVDKSGMTLNKAVDFGLNSLHQHPTGALAQQTQQRVILDDPAWSRKADNSIFLQGARVLAIGDFSNHQGYAAS